MSDRLVVKCRDPLACLTGAGVVLADMTQLGHDLLQRKRFLDITGNGVNPSNDFGQRLDAEVIGQRWVDTQT